MFVANIYHWLADAATRVAGAGYLWALAVVCLVQYAVHAFRMKRARRENERVRTELTDAHGELEVTHRDRIISRLENQVLREFVSQTDLDRALDVLMKRYVPDPAAGAAFFIRFVVGEQIVHRSRGLSSQARGRLHFDESIIEQLGNESALHLGPHEIAAGVLELTPADRRRMERLHVVGVREGDELFGALAATSLFPAGSPLDQQAGLAVRLMNSVAANLKQIQAIEMKDDRLRLTSEMLELRAIADRNYEDPAEMFRYFLENLAEKLNADRAALFLGSAEGAERGRALVRCGRPHAAGARIGWQQHENTLAALEYDGEAPIREFDRNELKSIGVDSLVGSAVMGVLRNDDGNIGRVLITRSSSEPFSTSDRRLAAWATAHLAEAILRVLNHAHVERRAREDGLTELANRGEFDIRIRRELASAGESGEECSLILFDIDRFKSVNDTYGHQAGDRVLKSTADVLRDQVMRIRSTDRALLARYGGEEIAVLLPGIGTSGAMRIAESVRRAVESNAVPSGSQRILVTVSAGVSAFPEHGRSVDRLIETADVALYRAKQDGRNRVKSAEPQSDALQPA